MSVSLTLNQKEHEKLIFLPNEIFFDLKNNIQKPKHVAFAYSYYYLINYLYRYTKYSDCHFTQSIIKQILGYSPVNKDIDYLIKKNGILDSIGYTQTTTDYPVLHNLDSKNRPEFTLLSQFKKEHKDEMGMLKHNDRNFKIKSPTKAFYRSDISRMNNYLDGTFYEPQHTHSASVSVFVECMDTPCLGTSGFYVYCYIKKLIDMSYGKWLSISKEQIAKDTGFSIDRANFFVENLVSGKLLRVERQNFFNNPHMHSNIYRL